MIGRMRMDKVHTIQLKLSALSIFRGILTRSVPQALYRLLCALDSAPADFLRAYGAFFALLSERNCTGHLAYAMTEALLFDENRFTRSAAAGAEKDLPQEVLQAAATDCATVLAAAHLSAEEVLHAYTHYDAIAPAAVTLPRWHTGESAAAFAAFDGTLDRPAQWYRENGCGIFARYKAFIWRGGDIQPVCNYDAIDLDDFTGYERQRDKVMQNTLAFLDGKSCNNCLLYGNMGTGKSSTVKAVANAFRTRGLRIVEMPKERLMDFPLLVDKLAQLPLKFIIYIDDLSFQYQDGAYTALKAVLEGGLAARPQNALIYATSNRRHLVKERLSDRAIEVDDVHTRDNMQETLSLSDRFGLAVCYIAPSKQEYLDIVRAMAQQRGVDMPDEALCAGAERFALSRGGRSPRCAKQYIESLFC